MSLILDALKKSEQERRRERVPDLQSIHQVAAAPVRRRELRWGWLLLAAVNVIAVAAWWWHQREVSMPAGPKQAVATAPVTPPASTPSAAAVAPQPAIPAPREAVGNNEFTRIEPSVPSAKSSANNSAPIEEFNELSPDLRNALPAMTFSFHVYSSDPQNRTIIINNQRMREGDEVSAGVVLQSITEDGVVLAMDHHRIHINVLTGW